jgi:predicted ester cyclase
MGMTEAPERYCSNCGHELSLEDQICPNCGRPVHQTARVPTPEADMPVPPLGTRGDPAEEADSGEHQQRSSSAEETKAVSNRVAEAISRGDLDALDELMAPDIARGYKEGIAEVRRAFPNYHGTNEIQIAEGDMVANHFVFYGTHRGEFMGIAPTGREVRFTGLTIDRVVDGKIVENWIEGDLEDLLQQIGAVVRAEASEEAGST